jgi:molybdate transport system substrate-binding protein
MTTVMQQSRRGITSTAILYAVGSVTLIGLLGWFLIGLPDKEDNPDEIVLYCAAGIKKPVAEAAAAYAEEQFGVPVRIQYGGSGTLLTALQLKKSGDLYLAADVSYINIAREKGVLAESIPLATQRAVIAVKKGNPKNIQSIKDLLREDVKFALANPDAASIGKLTKKVLEKTGEWKAIKEKAKVFKPTVNDILVDVRTGSVDAAIVWDANVKQDPEHLEMKTTDAFDAAKKRITIGVLKWTTNAPAVLRFARYLQAPGKGQEAFKKHGYEILPDADEWSIRPSLNISSGGVNRVAIEKTLEEFKKREGIELNVKYNGCGIIVGEIKSGDRPDAYFACDASFMVQVQDKFHDSVILSETDMVIVTKKDNPKEIKSLNHLANSGVRVGVANAEQSALGALTKNLLKSPSLKIYDSVMKNVKFQAPTADLLVNQIRAGKLDAVVVYRANVSQIKDKVDVITIKQGKPLAVQPIAVGKESKYPHLTRRLVDALTTELSQKRFEEAAFRWRKEAGKKE